MANYIMLQFYEIVVFILLPHFSIETLTLNLFKLYVISLKNVTSQTLTVFLDSSISTDSNLE